MCKCGLTVIWWNKFGILLLTYWFIHEYLCQTNISTRFPLWVLCFVFEVLEDPNQLQLSLSVCFLSSFLWPLLSWHVMWSRSVVGCWHFGTISLLQIVVNQVSPGAACFDSVSSCFVILYWMPAKYYSQTQHFNICHPLLCVLVQKFKTYKYICGVHYWLLRSN